MRGCRNAVKMHCRRNSHNPTPNNSRGGHPRRLSCRPRRDTRGSHSPTSQQWALIVSRGWRCRARGGGIVRHARLTQTAHLDVEVERRRWPWEGSFSYCPCGGPVGRPGRRCLLVGSRRQPPAPATRHPTEASFLISPVPQMFPGLPSPPPCLSQRAERVPSGSQAMEMKEAGQDAAKVALVWFASLGAPRAKNPLCRPWPIAL
jgi:hypothetical protein